MPFDFLKLPTDIRLCVYDFVPIQTTHTRILGRPDGYEPPPIPPREDILDLAGALLAQRIPVTNLLIDDFISVKLVTKSLPCAILLTCREVYDEALPIIRQKQARLLANTSPPRLFITVHRKFPSDLRVLVADEVRKTLSFIIRTLSKKLITGDGHTSVLQHNLCDSDVETLHWFAANCAKLRDRRATPDEPKFIDVSLDVKAYPGESWKISVRVARALEVGSYMHRVRMNVVDGCGGSKNWTDQEITSRWRFLGRPVTAELIHIEDEEWEKLWSVGEQL
ncbi:hypothetical protein BU23DRAFT_96473 [Bimuria novae-zelandiae CBS 107.79]|uniref:F-box domain-containing protein n=1 Tax=Bimuria novae-zelandiae CBS 107.79 TaxID=1447943 RepID=A0A6A5VMM9_9PLEO|nr:hypothetical protein BU23DRAFT_96473 [Bimuria novae-zelandiae CBS 107.79]